MQQRKNDWFKSACGSDKILGRRKTASGGYAQTHLDTVESVSGQGAQNGQNATIHDRDARPRTLCLRPNIPGPTARTTRSWTFT
jgi:hypothetical protein